ncbi:MAG: FliM/FliN family flagellar motor switch protein [Methylibium sp.]|nr:FliM/FliN family flagellar motor switch protein [Methylibium sp.]
MTKPRTCAPETSLRDHPALPQVSTEIAQAFRLFYGRQLEPLVSGDDIFTVRFEEVLASQAGMQLRVRCAGHDFELQIVEPSVVVDTGAALAPTVPDSLRCAAVMHSLQPLWQAVERRLGASIEQLSLHGSVPARSPDQALGLSLTRTSGKGGAASQPTRSALLLRALQPLGWQQLAQAVAAGPLFDLPPMHDVLLTVALQCDPVGLTLDELAHMEAGDVLLLDAPAAQLGSVPVRLVLEGKALPCTRALQSGRRLEIVEAPTARTTQADASRPNWRRRDMEVPDTPSRTSHTSSHGEAAPSPVQGTPDVDAIMVDIELELGRLSLPVSALRSLAVGQVFETVQPIEGNRVVLWCGGRQLGLGQLVAVGDRLGVRVAALQAATEASGDGGRRRTAVGTPPQDATATESPSTTASVGTV